MHIRMWRQGLKNFISHLLNSLSWGVIYSRWGRTKNAFKFEDQYENPDSSSAESDYKWVKVYNRYPKD